MDEEILSAVYEILEWLQNEQIATNSATDYYSMKLHSIVNGIAPDVTASKNFLSSLDSRLASLQNLVSGIYADMDSGSAESSIDSFTDENLTALITAIDDLHFYIDSNSGVTVEVGKDIRFDLQGYWFNLDSRILETKAMFQQIIDNTAVKTDLSGITKQLETVCAKLDSVSASAGKTVDLSGMTHRIDIMNQNILSMSSLQLETNNYLKDIVQSVSIPCDFDTGALQINQMEILSGQSAQLELMHETVEQLRVENEFLGRSYVVLFLIIIGMSLGAIVKFVQYMFLRHIENA